MTRILLADDSPHAQRMGEMILREEGYEVASVTDGETALLRLADVDPDVILVDVYLPKHSGYEICRYVKSTPRHQHARVVLLAGLLEPVDEEEVRRCGSDGLIKKPFEASAVAKTVHALVQEAQLARGLFGDQILDAQPAPEPPQAPAAAVPAKPHVDPERVEAAVTLALDAAMPALIKEITERVLLALGH
ncbi:MAG: response regulator [Acidobacteria bacterium]|nr:response regulator [Acidobacteriota bacterium]